MTLEEAQAQIEALNTQIAGLKDNAGISKEDHEKALQKAENKGFDNAKNKLEKDMSKYVSQKDVDDILAKRDTAESNRDTLRKFGVKNSKNAMKLIDDVEDYKLSQDDFKKKYSDSIVFDNNDAGNKQHIKNNVDEPPKKNTAEDYSKMNKDEKSKLTAEQKAEML